jgi:hypothetical protein
MTAPARCCRDMVVDIIRAFPLRPGFVRPGPAPPFESTLDEASTTTRLRSASPNSLPLPRFVRSAWSASTARQSASSAPMMAHQPRDNHRTKHISASAFALPSMQRSPTTTAPTTLAPTTTTCGRIYTHNTTARVERVDHIPLTSFVSFRQRSLSRPTLRLPRPSCVVRPASSVLRRPTTASSVLRRPSCGVRPASSVLRRPPCVVRPASRTLPPRHGLRPLSGTTPRRGRHQLSRAAAPSRISFHVTSPSEQNRRPWPNAHGIIVFDSHLLPNRSNTYYVLQPSTGNTASFDRNPAYDRQHRLL